MCSFSSKLRQFLPRFDLENLSIKEMNSNFLLDQLLKGLNKLEIIKFKGVPPPLKTQIFHFFKFNSYYNLRIFVIFCKKNTSPYLIPFWNGSRAKLAGQVILLYKKWTILAKNSIYFSYYEHIKVHLNGFIVQIILETNEIDQIKPFIAVWLGHRLEKRLKTTDFWHFFTKTRFSQNEILALF